MAGFSVSLHAAAHIPVSGNLNLQSRRPLGVRQETESRREIPRYRETCTFNFTSHRTGDWSHNFTHSRRSIAT